VSPDVQASADTYDLVGIAGGRPETVMDATPIVTGWFSASTTFSSPDPAATFQCRYEESNVWFACSSPQALITNHSGIETFLVRAVGANGLADATPASRDWYADKTPPVAAVPTVVPAGGGAATSAGLPFRVSWPAATDAISGVAGYRLEVATDGLWGPSTSAGATTAVIRRLAPGHTYRFKLAAVDLAGNVSSWQTGSQLVVRTAQEGDASIVRTGRWVHALSPAWWAGGTRYSTDRGATASITVTARAFAWVGAVGPGRGQARVFVDGHDAGVVNLHALASRARVVVFAKEWAVAARHTIVIRVLGTAGHARVDLDGFAWIR